MTTGETTDPRERMGVYKRFDEVPSRHRLHHHAAAYEGHDVWADFEEEELAPKYDSDRFWRDTRLAEERWKAHMKKGGRHHALAVPEDVEAWNENLLDRYQVSWAWKHVLRVEQFYDWLVWHTEHPHVYNPVLMAVVEHEDGASGELWGHKVSQREWRPNDE